MLLTPSLKTIASIIVACLLGLCALPAHAQTARHRKHVASKRTKAVAHGQPVNGGDLCGKPITLVTDGTDASAKNTVTVQVTIDEAGNVLAAQAVSGDPK